MNYNINKNLGLVFLLIFAFLFLYSCENSSEENKKELVNFIKKYEEEVSPLYKEFNLASYNASITGNEADYKKAVQLEIELTKIYSNKEKLETLKKIKESGKITDTLLNRQLEILYNKFIQYQVDEDLLRDIITLESEIQRKFSIYRPVINEKEISDLEIEEVLSHSSDTEELKEHWLASKKVSKEIETDLIDLVKKRNKVATELGFSNYYEMMLITNGQNPNDIENLFEELDIMTEGPYSELKASIDEALSKKYGVPQEELMPWHYQNRFFQSAPIIYEVNFDKYYKNEDLVNLTKVYYSSIGLDMTDILDNSDLYPKEGKSQLAYTTNIDKSGVVKILTNVKDNEYSMYALLYETGFASTIKYIDKDLPYILREPSHFIISDATGNIFHRLSKNSAWLKNYVGISKEEQIRINDLAKKQLRLEKFVFSRWAQVMFHFEKSLYENPDQDLNVLWWELVSHYQLLTKPEGRNEPDWASKTHIISYPCSYHNYMLGELLASQVCFYIRNNVLLNKNIDYFPNENAIGEYLIEHFFKLGASKKWDKIIEDATGESLSPVFFANQYIRIQ